MARRLLANGSKSAPRRPFLRPRRRWAVAEPARPRVYSIAAHRGFADALVARLVRRSADDEFGWARLTLLLPRSRAARTVSDALIRHAGELGRAGLPMPRRALVGDPAIAPPGEA